jgi:hypothetical protein
LPSKTAPGGKYEARDLWKMFGGGKGGRMPSPTGVQE